MKNFTTIGVSRNYVPPSHLFSIDVYNCEIELNCKIDSIVKLSCFIEGSLDNTFESLDSTYASIYINIDLRIDYIHDDKDISFYMHHIDKFMYIEVDDSFSLRNFNLECEILDLDIIEINHNKINLFILPISCLS